MSRSRKIEAVFAIVVMHGVAIAGVLLLAKAAVEMAKLAFGPPPRDFGPTLLGAGFAAVLLIPAARFAWGMYQGIKDAES